MSDRARGALWRGVVSLATFAIVLAGTSMAVSRLSNSDQITLSGGIAIFATVLTAWIVGVVALWTRWWSLSRIAISDDVSLGSTPPCLRAVAGEQRAPEPLPVCDSARDRTDRRSGERPMANKDKGGKSTKTTASKTLKEKRAAKKEKKRKGAGHRTG